MRIRQVGVRLRTRLVQLQRAPAPCVLYCATLCMTVVAGKRLRLHPNLRKEQTELVWVLWPGTIRHSAATVAETEPVGAPPNTALYSVIHDILIARWTK
jgi:hypothetical protein